VSNVVDQSRLDANWRAISAELDAPRPSVLERALRRVRVPGHVARLVVATPALRRAWYLSIAVAVLVGLGSSQPGDRGSLFALLVLAPALPVLGVALAYGPSADPLYDVQLATPMRGVRLVLVRAVTVLACTIVFVGGPALLAPDVRAMAFAWLLPALALTAASLALMTWLPPRRAAAVVAVTWFAVAAIVEAAGAGELAAFGVVGQAVALGVGVAAAALTFGRRAAFDRMGAAA
jgi:hypothetical protein